MQLALASYRSEDGTIVPVNIATPWNNDRYETATGENELHQMDAPPARTARVQERNAIGGYDICGTVALANLSPIGVGTDTDDRRWKVTLSRRSSQGEDLKDVVEDVELELHIAYQEQL